MDKVEIPRLWQQQTPHIVFARYPVPAPENASRFVQPYSVHVVVEQKQERSADLLYINYRLPTLSPFDSLELPIAPLATMGLSA